MTKSTSLQNQVFLYSLETKDFYTDKEKYLSDAYFKFLRMKKRITEKRNNNLLHIEYLESLDETTEEDDLLLERCYWKIGLYKYQLANVNQYIEHYKSALIHELSTYGEVRQLREDSLHSNKLISLFESTLTRVCKLGIKEISEQLFVIRVFHYEVLRSIIKNGFYHKGEHYKYFTSSAGQIRTKKIVCINTSLFEKYEDTITCGLSLDEINRKKGVNANKYQAYLALINSASDEWKRFNIDRVVVVDDFSTIINAEVDYINRETYQVSREFKDIEIEHMDGCGIMLPTVSKKSFMFRMPWMKGLLTPFDFKKFAIEHKSTEITDIYGKKYDIIKDNINIILTKSQFKMWKYYDSWDDYKVKFKKFRCEASKLNVEDIGADANINYQMLQTLVTMSDDELQTIAQNTIDDILNLGSDKKTMLRVLGATKENTKKNYFQKSLLLYPELLTDTHSREVIKNKKKSLVKEARAGKLRINGKYTFLIPDLYAFCEWLFLGEKQPKGLLKNKEVYCDIFEEGKVDVLRAPHLYREHAVRNNVKSEVLSEWFISKGIYTSCHDLISRILQFDNDGDKALVVQDETLVQVAEREMEGIVPLYYEMKKAEDVILDAEKMFISLISAYKANIGIISNDITKVWNSENPDVDVVKWLTMYNNFVIDYAKTLYLPQPPKEIEETIKSFTKNRVPHFFKYAKDKDNGQVEKVNDSTVNKLFNMIPNKPIQFKRVGGKFKHRDLMYNKYPIPSEVLIEKFTELSLERKLWMDRNPNESEIQYDYIMRNELFKLHKSKRYVVDVLVEYLYTVDSKYKNSLWNMFGDIIYDNLTNNLQGTISCENCSKRVESMGENNKYCVPCGELIEKEKNREYARKSMRKRRSVKGF